MKIYIAGLDKAEALAALMTALGGTEVTRDQAVDYCNDPDFRICGINIHAEPIDVTQYDAENGNGAAQAALEPLFQKMRDAAAVVPDGEVRRRDVEKAFEGQGGQFGGGGASASFDAPTTDSSSSSDSGASSDSATSSSDTQ